jgi:hypothetical protein
MNNNQQKQVQKPKFPVKIDKDIKAVLKENGYEWDYTQTGNGPHNQYINLETGKKIVVCRGTIKDNTKSRYIKRLEKEIQN